MRTNLHFGPEGAVTILLRGAAVRVPRAASLLDALAALRGGRISRGNYCWSGECAHCEVTVTRPDGAARTVMACRQPVVEGLRVDAVSRYLRKDLAE